ncbi:phosphotransferase [Candidatus Bathyarchaeota archaeon]|nr:phosphotransferase [Candidatus Bathyarchaeota archaeon]
MPLVRRFGGLAQNVLAKLPFAGILFNRDTAYQHLERLSDYEKELGEPATQALAEGNPKPVVQNGADDDGDEHEHEKGALAKFDAVLEALNQDKLPQRALSTRQKMQPQYSGKAPTVSEPTCGSYNICFSLTFDDNTQWLIRFPITGTKGKWTDASSRALATEAKTMIFLKKDTSIPLPDVFEFCATPDNELNCPYILMSYITGYPLQHVWWGHHVGLHTPEENEKCRRRMLEGVASAAKQLTQFSFTKGGSLEFDDQGRPSGVSSLRIVDNKPQHDRILKEDEEGGDPVYFEAGPFENPEDQYLSALNMRREKADPVVEILKMVLRLIPENDEDEHQFDLAHPDFAPQNIIVSEEGEIRGIIDWDGVAVVPLSVGSRRYPSWITRDWDFMNYTYEEAVAEGGEDLGPLKEDSPEALKRYRDLYRKVFDESHPGLLSPVSASVSTELMRMSVVAGTVYTAAMEPCDLDLFMNKLMDKVSDEASDHVDVGFFDLYMAVEDKEVDDDLLDCLEEAFASFLETDL